MIGEYVDKPRATSYGVGYLLEACDDRIEFWGGNSWNFSGGGIALDKVVDDPYWLEHFRNAKAEWFYDFVLRMAKGESISNAQIEAEYFLRHGEAIKLTGCTRYSYYQPMHLHLHHGNLLDIPADVLVCSANVSLNLTGGVGGELLLRYGGGMQEELHALLKDRERCFARPGEVFLWQSPNSPYLGVLHAVAIDGFYQSSVEMITKTCRVALQKAADLGAKRVAMAALATGFGNLDLDDFAHGLRPLLNEDFSPIEELHLSQIEWYRYQELRAAFAPCSPKGAT
ncbi:MAG: O-acetyl-ADP-ribose deacetylase [Verrucomicrobiota bacterium]